MVKITIARPDDMHVHLRQSVLLEQVAAYTAQVFGRALVMPNTDPPVITPADVASYYHHLHLVTDKFGFQPLMTFKITQGTKPWLVDALAEQGLVVAGKLYPEGVTTNSGDGVRDIETLFPVFDRMQHHDIVLSLHGEAPECDWPKSFMMVAEHNFLPTLKRITTAFPKLRIVLEHITTRAAVKCVKKLPNTVAATITVHHLLITGHQVMGERGKMYPHNFCKPVAKFPHDRHALQNAALSGNPKFFLGTDSAPHDKRKKECDECCAGCFTAPIAIQLLADFFDEMDSLELLEDYTSTFAADFYRLPRSKDKLALEQTRFVIPRRYGSIVPFYAGRTINWSIAT